MNPWIMTFLMVALGFVLLKLGIGKGYEAGYYAGFEDGDYEKGFNAGLEAGQRIAEETDGTQKTYTG